jgi:hypothetical protein
MKLALSTITGAVLILSGCGATEIMKNVDDTYKVAAQYGSVNGSWDRASQEANQKALVYCQGMGKKLVLIDERREGVWGMSPQRAEVKFKCTLIEDSSSKELKSNSIEAKLNELKSLFQKGLMSKEQYDLQVDKALVTR